MSKSDAYQNPARVREWLFKQRDLVTLYLKGQRIGCDRLPVPAWDLAPYVAVWSIPGCWAISGDLPTDFILHPEEEIRGPREAVRFFARRFAEVAECMLAGRRHPVVTIGDPADAAGQRQLGDLLARRAELLRGFADNDNLWPEQLDEWQEKLDPAANEEFS
jgi:hypothetical protein